jgi:hypothetical protein
LLGHLAGVPREITQVVVRFGSWLQFLSCELQNEECVSFLAQVLVWNWPEVAGQRDDLAVTMQLD